MEKNAAWWNKYYASKAKLVLNNILFVFPFEKNRIQKLNQRSTPSFDDAFKDSTENYADFFDNEKSLFFIQTKIMTMKISCRNSSQTKIWSME